MTVERLRAGLTREISLPNVLSWAMGVAIFTTLTTLGAFVRIPLPFTPVPLTLQTFFVLLGGAMLGSAAGSSSQSLYLILGASGLPVFAGARGGLSHLAGPTGGYLIGFVVAAYLVGKVVERKDSSIWLILAMLAGTGVIYLLGGLRLAHFLRIGIKQTLYLGVIPFLPGDILKFISVVLVYKLIRAKHRVSSS
ncbi:hypothetical protein ES703_78623 [subsurface metagenome]